MRHLRSATFALCGSAALLLAGCAGGSESFSLPNFFGDTKPAAEAAEAAEVPEEFRQKPSCPAVEIRDEAESMQIFDPPKSTDASALRYQINIQRVARDCDSDGTTITARVGVAGRVIAGPKGGAGTVQVPLRVVVLDSAGKPVYSQAHIVPVAVDAPDFSALWSQVDEQVRFPVAISGDARILVGLDEQALKGGAVRSPARPAKRS